MTFGTRKVPQFQHSLDSMGSNVMDTAHPLPSINRAKEGETRKTKAAKPELILNPETPATVSQGAATPAEAQPAATNTTPATIHELHAPKAGTEGTSSPTPVINPLETATAAEHNPEGKIAAFATAVAVPASYASLRETLAPLQEKAEKARSPFTEAVRNNPLAKFLGISFLPALPFTFHALSSMTKRDHALAEISATQTQFSKNIIQDRSLAGLLERTEAALPLLLGIEYHALSKEIDSNSPAAAAVALASRLISQFTLVKLDAHDRKTVDIFTTTEGDSTVGHRDIEEAKAQIREIRAFISGEPRVVQDKLEAGGVPPAFEKLISVMSGGPALLGPESKGYKVDSLIAAVMPEERAREMGARLGEVGSKLKESLGVHAERIGKAAEGLGEKLETSRKAITAEATNAVLNNLQAAANDPQIHSAAREAHSVATNTAHTIAERLPSALGKGLSMLQQALKVILQPKAANDDRYEKTA